MRMARDGAARRFTPAFRHGQPDEVGFMRARSHDIIAIDNCPLFSPGMAGAISAAHALGGDLRGLMKPLDIGVTATLDGLDVDLRGSGPLGRAEMQKLTRTAEALDLARVSNHGEIVIERRPPARRLWRCSGEAAARRLPAGDRGGRSLARGRLPSGRWRTRKRSRTCSAARAPSRSGSPRSHEVFAADADPAAIAALARAAATTPGLRALTVETRDLFRRPLRADELATFDAALIDPPRAGALEQARAFAASTLPLVVSISCNAATFARDARVLIDGGFQIDSVTPLDQFRFSAHVEIVAVFRRPNPKKRARGFL